MKKLSFAIIAVLAMTVFVLAGCSSEEGPTPAQTLHEEEYGNCRTLVDDSNILHITPLEEGATIDSDGWWNNDKTGVAETIEQVFIESSVAAPKTTSGMFAGLSNVTYIDANGLDTSKTTDMSRMFDGCAHLEKIDLSSWNTSNVKDMSLMFSGCKALRSLHLDNWDFSKVEKLDSMFDGCDMLYEVYVADDKSAQALKKVVPDTVEVVVISAVDNKSEESASNSQ